MTSPIRWSPADQQKLNELIERKKAFDEEMLKPIDELLARTLTIDAGPGIAKSQRKIRTWLIWNADAVRDEIVAFVRDAAKDGILR